MFVGGTSDTDPRDWGVFSRTRNPHFSEKSTRLVRSLPAAIAVFWPDHVSASPAHLDVIFLKNINLLLKERERESGERD